MNKKVIIIGAGGHAKVIREIVEECHDVFVGFLDDKQQSDSVIGIIDDIERWYQQDKKTEFIIGIGNNEIRSKIYQQYKEITYYTAIHPSAIIGKKVTIGEGTAIMANVVINGNSKIGKNCIINTASIIEHDCYVENGAHLSYRVTIGAGSKIGEEAYLDIGTIVDRNVIINKKQKVKIGGIIKGGDCI